MLNLSTDIICTIILKAKQFLSKEAVSFPELTNEMDAMQPLADHQDDLNYQEVITNINDLEPQQQMTLVALMYIGRGDYTKDEWQEAFDTARENWTLQTGEYLLSRPTMPDDIEQGLNELEIYCNE